MTESYIAENGGVPTLFVDGKAVPGIAYITYYTDNNAYSDFTEKGYILFSVPVYFAERSINARTGFPPFAKGIFDGKTPDFSIFDNEMEKLVSKNPSAYVFPRINMNLSKSWDDENPDELCDICEDHERRVCFSSDKWAEKTKEYLEKFINHAKNSKYSKNIIGYQIAGGNTEEWLSFDGRGNIGPRSREAFEKYKDQKGIEGTESEYYEFLSHVVAKRICEFAHLAKALTDGKQVIGTFYGYTLECPRRESAHHALGEILDSGDVDFICSPVSYAYCREPGRDHPNMTVIDSVKMHGKLYFSENDTRTHLSKPGCSLPAYNTKLWFGKDRSTTVDIMKMHYARALCHGHAMWWFDMWGGWYKDEIYMDLLGKMYDISERSLKKPLYSVSQVAVFADEKAYAKIPPEDTSGFDVCGNFRETLGLAGASYDIYLINDFEQVKDNYKAFVFFEPVPLETIENAVKKTEKSLVITTKNCKMTPDELRKFYKSCGVDVICDRDSVIYENASYIFLHTKDEGEYTLNVKEELRELFGKEIKGKKIYSKGKESFLFEKNS